MESTEKQREDVGTRTMSFSNQERGASYKSANNSFSGADMVAVMSISGGKVKGSCVLGTLQTISISTSMNRMPIRAIGNINAKDYVMGQRTIAGSLVFAVFDKHFMYEAIEEINGLSITGNHFLADELPPFDITISFANEYGRTAKMAIYGVRLISEGQVMSINDVFTENTYQYVATDIDYINNYDTNASGDIPKDLPVINDKKGFATITNAVSVDDTNRRTEKDQKLYLTTTDSIARGDTEEKGMVSIDVPDRAMYGSILITGSGESKEFQVDMNAQFPIVCKLSAGKYQANFISKAGSRGDDVNFEIRKVEIKKEPPLKPILISSKKRDNLFDIYVVSQDTSAEKIEYSKSDGVWSEAIKDKDVYTISGIGENSLCKIRSSNSESPSNYFEVTTDARKEHMIDDFKNFVMNLKESDIGEKIYISKVLDLTASEEDKNIPLFSTMLENISKKIDITDEKTRTAYFNIMCECIKYENMFARLTDSDSRVKAPKLVDMARSIIELGPETEMISIESSFTYSKSVTKESFTRYDGRYLYELRLHSAGLYKVTAKDKNGKKSMPVNIYVPTQPHALSMIKEREIKNANLKKEMAYSEAKVSIFLNKKINNLEKIALINEINNDYKKIKVGVTDPSIKYMSEKEVIVTADITPAYEKSVYLCILKSSDIGSDKKPSRVLITNNKFEYSYYAAKEGLEKGERYSIWIENDSSIVSGTSGFTMDSKESAISDIRFEETKNIMKAGLDTQENMDFINSAAVENTNSQSSIYTQMIMNNIYFTPNNELRTLLINDSMSAMHRAYFEITPPLNISELSYSLQTDTLSWTVIPNKYTKVVVTTYKNKTAATFAYCTDEEVALNEFQRNADYLCFFFCDDDLKSVSEVTTIDTVTQEVISPFEMGVV